MAPSFSMNPDDYIALPIPPLPQTQGLASTTFKLPPLDGSLSVPELHDWQAEHSSHHPLFEFAEDDGTIKTITWEEANTGIHRAGWYVKNLLETVQENGRPVVAILAASDYITYYTFLVGILRAGYIAFFISPRNSAVAVAHLLSKTNSTHVFVGAEENLQLLADNAMKLLQRQNQNLGNGGWNPSKLWKMPVFEDLYPQFGDEHDAKEEGDKGFVYLPRVNYTLEDLAIITHSSGSTAYPKPIRFTHYRYLNKCFAPFFGEMDKTGMRMSNHSIPLYHGMGMIQTAWAVSCGLILNSMRPRAPAIPITSETVLKGFSATKSDIIFCVPTFVEDWARDPEAIKLLQQTKGVFFGGGPLSKAVGDELTDQGIDIFNTYGIGECGIMSPLYPERLGKEWEYFRFTSNISAHFVQGENGYSEAYILPNKYHVPNVLNATVEIDGERRPAYATSDFLEPHPTKPGYWKIIDRIDNQIIHSTGEKTNPGPLESILHHDPHIESAVVFGRGKFNAGVLVDPKEPCKFDPSDTHKLAEFRDKIWPSVKKANEYAPQHSRIFKEMILVSRPSKPFDYTAKFTVRRQAMIAFYEPEIEALYGSVDETTQAGSRPPAFWDLANTLTFVRNVVTKVVKDDLADDDDFFQKGCDSLQATWIRNSILHALRNSPLDVNVRQIPQGFVYHYPKIIELAAYVSSIVPLEGRPGAKGINGEMEPRDPVHFMLQLLQKYSSDFPVHRPVNHIKPLGSLPDRPDVILITGTTGGLGASLLSTVITSEDVGKVYALNRISRDGKSLRERQRGVFKERGIDSSLLDSSKLVLVEADLARSSLGLSHELFEEIASSVTHIIHNAYHVDWKVRLESFEPHIRAFRNLIDLSLASPRTQPPRLLFTSTIGVLRHHPDASSDRVAETLAPPESAIGTGYRESKWVCEKLASLAAEKTPLRPVIIRIGQVAGSKSGVWKTSEWFPSLVKSSIHLGALPTENKEISWILAENAAQVLVDLRNALSSEAQPFIAHLTHARPIPAKTVMEALSKELDLPLVPFPEWVDLLDRSGTGNQDELANPALKMLDFFKEGGKDSTMRSAEAFGVVRMDIANALKGSKTLREDVKELSEIDVKAWVAYWRKVGFV